jgi:CRISPR system Cascade subunit CasB
MKQPVVSMSSIVEESVRVCVAGLQARYLNGDPQARAQLARLRRGLGRSPAEDAEGWAMTIEALPGEVLGHGDDPSVAESAAHLALTMFAAHLQSASGPMHVPGVGFGSAMRSLGRHEDRSTEAVRRRFSAVMTASSSPEMAQHLRGLVSMLRQARVGLDYGQLARDLYFLSMPGQEHRVRLRWGRDFYRSEPKTDITKESA